MRAEREKGGTGSARVTRSKPGSQVSRGEVLAHPSAMDRPTWSLGHGHVQRDSSGGCLRREEVNRRASDVTLGCIRRAVKVAKGVDHRCARPRDHLVGWAGTTRERGGPVHGRPAHIDAELKRPWSSTRHDGYSRVGRRTDHFHLLRRAQRSHRQHRTSGTAARAAAVPALPRRELSSGGLEVSFKRLEKL